MSAKKFTVLIIPEGSHRVRRFCLKRWVLSSLLSVILLAMVGVGLLAYDYSRLSVNRAELAQLRSANRQQQAELASLTGRIEALRKDMVVLAQNDAKVRVMAQLAPTQADSLGGVGGPPEVDPLAEFSELQQRIDEIHQAIDLRRESQEEVRGFLNDQRSLVAAKPTGWPVNGWLTSTFGMRKSPFTGKRTMHDGLDIAAATGTPVYATADGIVSRAGTQAGYGKVVTIDHGYGYKTYYAHNSKIFVKVGQRVSRGDKIAAVGNTGRSTGPHVHYEVRLNNAPLNPRKFL